MPFATLLVPTDEVELYRHTGLPIETVPPEIRGLGPLRNWVLDNYQEHTVVMVDDDITNLWCTCRESGYSVKDPEAIEQLLRNTAQLAMDLGSSCFGYQQAWDVRKYRASQPFSFNSWVGGVIGVIGRKHRFMENQKFKVDIDFCLEVLRHDRIVLRDNRYSFVQTRNTNKGGNSVYRTQEAVEREFQRLKNKWGKYIKVRFTKSGETTTIHVDRKKALL